MAIPTRAACLLFDDADPGAAGSDVFAAGTVVGDRYRVVGLLGEGGQGRVYRAEHVEIGTPLALKVGRADDQDEHRERFAREARMGAQVRHRNVVGVFDVGVHENIPYLVMELVEGETLAEVLAVDRLTPSAVVELGVQLLAALHALEEQRIVHRDIKPENIVLHRAVDGEVIVKLLDFGVSKSPRPELVPTTITMEGTVVGTPLYMSPEQVRGASGDGRSDLFAVGAVLYECLSGTTPHPGASIGAVFASILEKAPVPLSTTAPECPRALADVIMRALATDPEERPPHPAAMADQLRGVSDSLGLARDSGAWSGVVDTPPTGRSTSGLRRALPRERSASTGWRALFGRLETLPSTRSLREGSWHMALVVARGTLAAVSLIVIGGLLAAWVLDTSSLNHRKHVNAPESAQHVEYGAPPPLPMAESESLESLERGARDLFLRGEPIAAAALYQQIVERDPQRAEAWRNLGLAALDAGQRGVATEAFAQYLRLRPDAPDAEEIERLLDASTP